MKRETYRVLYLALTLVMLPAWVIAEEVLEIEWDSLIPEDYRPDKIMNQFGDIDALEDSDPRAQQILEQLQRLWKEAPIVTALNGRRIKIPGFVVPLEGDGRKLTEFFLVPYYGACIHVPPPPANQIIYVKVPQADARIHQAFDTVWVTGRISAQNFTSDLGSSGYQLDAERVVDYE